MLMFIFKKPSRYRWGDYPSPSYINRILALSPDVYWPMQEISGTTMADNSGNSYAGSIYNPAGSIAINQVGHYGRCYRLVGNFSDDLESNATLTAFWDANEFSFACWAKCIVVAGTNPKIMESWAGLQYYALEMRDPNGASIGVFLREADGDQTITTGAVIPNNTWFHLVSYNSLSGGITGIYLNGVKYEFSKTSALGIVGANNARNPAYWCTNALARVQHIAMWKNKVLSQTEVNTICT